jgi:hypothetical protein
MCAIAVPICTVLAVFGNATSDYLEAHVFAPVQRSMEKHHIHFPHRRPHPRPTHFTLNTPQPTYLLFTPRPR